MLVSDTEGSGYSLSLQPVTIQIPSQSVKLPKCWPGLLLDKLRGRWAGIARALGQNVWILFHRNEFTRRLLLNHIAMMRKQICGLVFCYGKYL